MQQVVRVFGPKAAENRTSLVRTAVAIGVLQVDQLGAVGDIDSAISRQNSGGYQQIISEHSMAVSHTIAIAVLDNDDLSVGGWPG